MSANTRRNLAVQLVPVGGGNPLKLRISSPIQFTLGTAGTTAALIGQGGVPAYAYSIVSGSLPTGLSLAGGTGIISGTPSASGTFTFAAQVQDSALTTFIATFSINVAHRLVPVNITPPDFDYGGSTITYQFSVSGNTGTVTYSSSGLPAYMSLSSAGLLSITTFSAPSGGGSVAYTVTATDGGSGDAVTYAITQTVYPLLTASLVPSPNIVIGATTLLDATALLAPTGGKAPYTYKNNSLNPSWVNVSTSGIVSITPPPTTTAGSSITLRVGIRDQNGIGPTPLIGVIFVNPSNVIQMKQAGSNAGTPGFVATDYTGGAFVVSNPSNATATVNLPAATNSVPGYLTTADHATLQSAAVSLSSFGATPNSAGASLTGGVFTLQPAATGFPGGVSTVAQNFDGTKTFNNQPVSNKGWAAAYNGHGTVTSTLALDFSTNINHSFILTTATPLTISVSANPAAVCDVTILASAPGAGSSPAITYPANFKGGWPTAITLAKSTTLRGQWDGTNYVYLGRGSEY